MNRCPLMEKFKKEVLRRKQEKRQVLIWKGKVAGVAAVVLGSSGAAAYFFLHHSLEFGLVGFIVTIYGLCLFPQVLKRG